MAKRRRSRGFGSPPKAHRESFGKAMKKLRAAAGRLRVAEKRKDCHAATKAYGEFAYFFGHARADKNGSKPKRDPALYSRTSHTMNKMLVKVRRACEWK